MGAGTTPPPAQPGRAAGGREQPITEPFPENVLRPTVSLVHGDSRRKNVCDALVSIDREILPKLKTKKYVLIKPNMVTARSRDALSATSVDAIHGILDYLAPRFKGPIVIAESAGQVEKFYEVLGYPELIVEHKGQKVSLVDLNREGKDGKYVAVPVIDYHLHLVPIRLAARLLDPDAFVICAGIMKTHNTVVATLSIKNMAAGAPLISLPGETPRWSEKRKLHAGIRQTHFILYMLTQRLMPFSAPRSLMDSTAWRGMGRPPVRLCHRESLSPPPISLQPTVWASRPWASTRTGWAI